MTSTPAAPTPTRGPAEARSSELLEGRGAGLIEFAAILLGTFGVFSILDGIAAIAKSHVFTANADYVVGNLRAWGWAVLAFGILQLVAAGALVRGRSWARWFAIVVVALNALVHLMFLPSYPLWSIVVIAVDVIALYALTAYGGRPMGVDLSMADVGPESQRPMRPPV
jgi:hypothetical protein